MFMLYMTGLIVTLYDVDGLWIRKGCLAWVKLVSSEATGDPLWVTSRPRSSSVGVRQSAGAHDSWRVFIRSTLTLLV